MRLSLLLLAACGSSPEAPDPASSGPLGATITVAYQSRVDGEIEPCG